MGNEGPLEADYGDATPEDVALALFRYRPNRTRGKHEVLPDIDLMIELLDSMAEDPGGLILLPKMLGMSPAQRTRILHADFLADAGLAKWVSDSGLQITLQGAEFRNAVKQDRPKYTEKAKRLLGQGKSVLTVVANIVSIVNGVGGD